MNNDTMELINNQQVLNQRIAQQQDQHMIQVVSQQHLMQLQNNLMQLQINM